MAKEKKCPWFRKPCIKHDCVMYTNVQGAHPQTGEIMDRWGCAIEWLPILLLESSRQQLHTSGEISAFRSEMRNDNVALGSLLMSAAKKRGGNGTDDELSLLENESDP